MISKLDTAGLVVLMLLSSPCSVPAADCSAWSGTSSWSCCYYVGTPSEYCNNNSAYNDRVVAFPCSYMHTYECGGIEGGNCTCSTSGMTCAPVDPNSSYRAALACGGTYDGGFGDDFGFGSLTGGNTGTNLFSSFDGNGIDSGSGGLANDFGSTLLTGAEQGQPSFTLHGTTKNEQWLNDVMRRRSPIVSLRQGGVPPTTQNYEMRYLRGSLGVINKKGGTWRPPSGIGPTWIARPAPSGPSASTIGGSPITADGAQPTSGAGAMQGPPDPKEPFHEGYDGVIHCPLDSPYYNKNSGGCFATAEQCGQNKSNGNPGCKDVGMPLRQTPTHPVQDNGGGDVRCGKDQPYYNSRTDGCYRSAEECGNAVCKEKTAPLPFNPKPAKPQPPVDTGKPPGKGETQCRKAWWHNTKTGKCYPDEKTCMTASAAGARGTAADTGPLCSQPNP